MIKTPPIVIEKVAALTDCASRSLHELAAEAAAAALAGIATETVGGVVAATFSNPERFPSLAVRVATALGLPRDTPAFDLQMACSAYPYAVYLAGRLAADTGRRVLVVDGDLQTRLVDAADHATGGIFSDALTASVISARSADSADGSFFSFYSAADEALACGETGPVRMDGMKVFTFVATEVRAQLVEFLKAIPPPDGFVPHQANPYMVRQLAKSLGLADRLLTLDPALLNPGSCSIPLTLARTGARGRLLLAGFGAGFSAAAAYVEVR